MTQTFYIKWQSSVLADAGGDVSKEYNNFQTALLSEYCDMSQLQSMIDKLLS